MCQGLAEARGDAIQDVVGKVMVNHLGIDIDFIDIIQVFLYSTGLFEISYLIKTPVWLTVVPIVLPDSIFNLLPSIEPILVSFPPFQRICLCT